MEIQRIRRFQKIQGCKVARIRGTAGNCNLGGMEEESNLMKERIVLSNVEQLFLAYAIDFNEIIAYSFII